MNFPSELAGTPVRAHTVPRGIDAYRNLHIWLGIAFLIVLIGFSPTYFLRLGDATWFQHLHGISATLWVLFLVLQPYLATRKKLRRHRQFGVLALVLAGVVVASGLAVVPFNIENAVGDEISPLAPATFL